MELLLRQGINFEEADDEEAETEPRGLSSNLCVLLEELDQLETRLDHFGHTCGHTARQTHHGRDHARGGVAVNVMLCVKGPDCMYVLFVP